MRTSDSPAPSRLAAAPPRPLASVISSPKGWAHHAGRVSRWGFLLTAGALVAALLGTALSIFFAVQGSTVPLVRLHARELVSTVRHQLHLSEVLTPEILDDIVVRFASEGVRDLRVLDASRQLLVQAGTPSALARWEVVEGSPQMTLELGPGGRARVEGPFIGPGKGAGWRARKGAAADTPLPWDRLEDARILVEFDPTAVQHLAGHAFATLMMAACAGLVLLGAVVVFWRLSLRAERSAAQLERDRHFKSLGQMSAVLGHELRNPLAGLKGHAQLVLRRLSPDDGSRAAVQTIVREAVRLERLANQVLEFTRTGEVEARLEDPVRVAEDAVEQVNGSRVQLVLPEARLPVWPIDRLRMEQVLVNLLRNALEASPGADPVELELRVEAGRWLVFEVRDRGQGFAPEDEQSLFEPFVTHRAKGSGLGLTLARQIVEGHGGRIEAENRPGGGAVFRVTVPGEKR